MYIINIEETAGIIHSKPLLTLKDLKTNENAETCRTICEKVPSVPQDKLKYLNPMGNLWKIVKSGVHGSLVNNTILPQITGGSWMFKTEKDELNEDCNSVPKSGVAIIFVCRDRWLQLNITMNFLIPILQKQRLCYRIFVIEQAGNGILNKARLLNVGFIEAMKRFHFDCVVFHDADLVPLNDGIPYGCDSQTKMSVMHLSVGVSAWSYVLPYKRLIGGVLKISNEHFLSVNGYSNSYWGWGGEDDDLEKRLKVKNINYVHIDRSVGQYATVPHAKQLRSNKKERYKLLDGAVKRVYADGLNTLWYRIENVYETQYFTHIIACIGDPF
ncbi:unnamed protein product [Trichobilharzia szidati]|nr:unnamed protein product [Trichobilharzia szidati]